MDVVYGRRTVPRDELKPAEAARIGDGADKTLEGASVPESIDTSIKRIAQLLEPNEAEPVLFHPRPGDVLADRFVIEQHARSGGMGAVYRAFDRLVGVPVAVKVLAHALRSGDDRFREEARLLAQLSHPAVVRYVTHSALPEGGAFLVMEWLEGEDLAQRLAMKPLTLEETLRLVSRTAEGLAVAHAAGIVHRDIKPSNLFLVGGEPSQVKLIDFGIARQKTRARVITRTGAVLGTVGYMAPEQARGILKPEARADVFSLGCVLFECLTGQPAFASEHNVAVLAKILLEEAPRVRDLCPRAPAALDDVVARMLSKDPSRRPANALAVLAELEDMGKWTSQLSLQAVPHAEDVLTGVEQRFTSIMLLQLDRDPQETAETPEDGGASEAMTHIASIVSRFGGECAQLGGDVILVAPQGQTGATDRAAQAASCALRLRAAAPSIGRIALATGRAETTGGLPVGPVIERAAKLLRAAPSPAAEPPGSIAIDEDTAGLLDSRFDVAREGLQVFLVNEHLDSEWPRTLLGKRTPCVGREKELATLDVVAAQCFAHRTAHALLVTGAPGVGKSRLRREFLARIRHHSDANVLLARADPMGAGSSLMLARQLVRNAMGLREGDPVASQHAAIAGYLSLHLAGADVARIGDFLAELVEAPSAHEPSPLLRAARNDARIMSEWMRRSFQEWLAAECGRRPLVLVLEDLHWGDMASLTYIEQAFGKLADSPLLVVAFARPEVHDLFPKLRAGIVTQEILLGGLGRRPAEQLVRNALGERAGEATITRIVEQADGNAFFIEELIRRVAENGSADLPDTVLAMMGARLQGVEAEARLILRAASIFGNVFWEGGIGALVRGFGPPIDVRAWLDHLVERELLTRERSNKFPGDEGFAFRHSLLREAAYAMLTDADRERGHLLAAEWLVRMGEKDSLVLADHYERGNRLEEAVPWLERAAEVALNGANNDVAAAIAERGLQGASHETLGSFLEIQQLACAFRGDWPGALGLGNRAMSLLPAGTTRWFRSAGSAMLASIYLGKPETTVQVLGTSSSLPTPEPSGPFGLALHMLVGTLLHAGAREMVLQLLHRLEAVALAPIDHDPAFAGWLRTVRCTTRLFLFDDVATALTSAQEALRCFDGAGDFVGWATAALYHGIALIEAGQPDAARPWLEDLIVKTNRALLPTGDFARYYLARVDALRGDSGPAENLLDGPPGLADGARGFVAEAHLRNGHLESATEHARQIEASASVYARVTGLAVLSRVALAEGRIDDALALVARALEEQDRGSAVPFWRSVLLLAKAEALRAAGRDEDARAAIDEAEARVLRIAASFDDPGAGAVYTNELEVNARTLALARAWRTE